MIPAKIRSCQYVREDTSLKSGLKKRPSKTAEGSGDSEGPQDAAIEMLPKKKETHCRSDEVRNGDGGYGQLHVEARGHQRREDAADPESRNGGNRASNKCGASQQQIERRQVNCNMEVGARDVR